MSNFLELIQSPIGQMIINGASSQLGQDTNTTQSALQTAIPMLMGALKKNASKPDTASGLMNALMNKHDGSLLDNVMDIFGGGFVNEEVINDGDKILGHVFGEKKEMVATAISKQNGIDMSAAMNILKIAAPIVMGMIGKQASEKQVSNPTDLTHIIGSMLGSNPETQQQSSFIEKLLDQDGDGSVIDDLFNIGKKFFGK